MSPRQAPKVCPVPRCPHLVFDGGSRCELHRREAEQLRGSAAKRGYGSRHRNFRDAVLRRDPLCVECGKPSTVADHWPLSRRELVARGLDPNDPKHGRGLCASDHGKATAAIASQRGGWNRRE